MHISSNKKPEAVSLSALLAPLQNQQHIVSNVYTHGMCHLAYNAVSIQSKMVAQGGISIDSFLHIISNASDPSHIVEATFPMIILARVFFDSKPTNTMAFGLKHLMKSHTGN